MNYKFRKKPIIIEAFQMTVERRNNNVDWPEWLHEAWNKTKLEVGGLYKIGRFDDADESAQKLFIKTLEGAMVVGWGDWIIRGVNGELYPCKPDIFEKTYEEVIDG